MAYRPDASDMWKFHWCKSCYLIATTPQCLDSNCAHIRCPYCPRGRPSSSDPALLCPNSSAAAPQYRYATMETNPNFSIPGPRSYVPPSAPPRQSMPCMATLPPAAGLGKTSYINNGSGGGGSSTGDHGRAFLASSASPSLRPSMQDWWKCCRDGHVNNPGLFPEFCAWDSHRKCIYCEAV